MQRIGRHGQRHLLPRHECRAHADHVLPIGQPAHWEDTHHSLNTCGPARFFEHQPRNTAGGIATGLGLRTVGVVYPHEHLRVVIGRRFEHDQLVTTHPKVPVSNPLRLSWGRLKRITTRIDNDEIIAQAVHLLERSRVHGVENRPFPFALPLLRKGMSNSPNGARTLCYRTNMAFTLEIWPTCTSTPCFVGIDAGTKSLQRFPSFRLIQSALFPLSEFLYIPSPSRGHIASTLLHPKVNSLWTQSLQPSLGSRVQRVSKM